MPGGAQLWLTQCLFRMNRQLTWDFIYQQRELPLPHFTLVSPLVYLSPLLLYLLQLPLLDQQGLLLLLETSCLRENKINTSAKRICDIIFHFKNALSNFYTPPLPSASALPSVCGELLPSSAPLRSFFPLLASSSQEPPFGSSRIHFRSASSPPALPLLAAGLEWWVTNSCYLNFLNYVPCTWAEQISDLMLCSRMTRAPFNSEWIHYMNN